MEERLSRHDILTRLDESYAALQSALACLTPAQMLAPNIVGVWSIKDVIAHLIYWNRFPVMELEYAQRGEVYPHEHLPDDVLNARAVEVYANQPLEVVLADFAASYHEVVAAVTALPDTAFEPDNAIERVLDETISGTFGNNTYAHYPIHEAQIRAYADSL